MLSPFIQSAKKTYFVKEMGYVLLLGGTMHFAGVSYLYFTTELPNHDRVAYIAFIGLVQLAVGLLDVLAANLIPLDRANAARVLKVSAILITGYAIIILPAYPDLSFLFKLAPPAYLLYHWWAFLRLKRKRVKL